MLFNSYQFLFFFPVVLAVLFVIPQKTRYIWLLVASYYFYMGWNPRYAILIAFSTLVTFLSGIAMDAVAVSGRIAGEDRKKFWQKCVVALSFTVNLAILFFFKYFDFAWVNLGRILSFAGVTLGPKPFDVLLPVGISFYTFQALGYTVDVYRGTIRAERNLFRYALFVSFFPQLVAGPIERSSNLLYQVNHVEDIKLWNLERITEGATIMVWGYFQKMVIADRASILVDTVYNGFEAYGAVERILATVLFAIQIYCDFASYSTIATGAAKVMGFDLMENFNTPYFAASIKDFWRRWHISLSTWFRDYLYFPLGGSRCSRAKKYRNLMITFLVSGLWHGAGWSYLVWGGLHGFYQVAGDLLRKPKEALYQKLQLKTESMSFRLGQVLITFCLVDFALIFFRMDSLKHALHFILGIITKWNPWALFDGSLYQLGLAPVEMGILFAGTVILLLVDLSRWHTGKQLEQVLKAEMIWFRWLVVAVLFVMVFLFGIYGPGFDAQAFIYFQF